MDPQLAREIVEDAHERLTAWAVNVQDAAERMAEVWCSVFADFADQTLPAIKKLLRAVESPQQTRRRRLLGKLSRRKTNGRLRSRSELRRWRDDLG